MLFSVFGLFRRKENVPCTFCKKFENNSMSFIYLSIYFFKLFVYSKILTFIYVFNRLIYLSDDREKKPRPGRKNN